ncbi:hypothetical protein Tco_1162619 [Tanacetum coccineum]
MVINSPCLTDKKELAIPGQTATGKEFSNPLMADSLPKTIPPTKFTATVETVNDGEQHITVTVDGQTIAITKAYVRRHLKLADEDGISSLPNTEIFEQLTLMRYVSNGDELTFQKGEYIPLFDSMLIHDQPGQGEGPTLTVESQHTPIASLTTSQPTTSQPMSSQEQPSQVPITKPIITTSFPPLYETSIPHTTSSMPHDLPLLRAKILADASRERVKTYKIYTRRRRSTVSSRDSTAGGLFSTAEEILSTSERIAQKLNKEEMAEAAAREE